MPRSCSATASGCSPAPRRPGPAFEGAQISCGQRAAPGAIERVRIDRDTLEPRFKVIGSDLWSNEPGFDESGRGNRRHRHMRLRHHRGRRRDVSERDHQSEDGVIDGAQMAALIAGSAERPHLLLRASRRRAGNRHHPERRPRHPARQGGPLCRHPAADGQARRRPVDTIRLAGAFGCHIDPKYAMVLGLIPDCPLDKVSRRGNAAGTGARMALLNTRAATRSRRWCADREDRDPRRAAVPASFRRGHGDPAQERCLSQSLPRRSRSPRRSRCRPRENGANVGAGAAAEIGQRVRRVPQSALCSSALTASALALRSPRPRLRAGRPRMTARNREARARVGVRRQLAVAHCPVAAGLQGRGPLLEIVANDRPDRALGATQLQRCHGQQGSRAARPRHSSAVPCPRRSWQWHRRNPDGREWPSRVPRRSPKSAQALDVERLLVAKGIVQARLVKPGRARQLGVGGAFEPALPEYPHCSI